VPCVYGNILKHVLRGEWIKQRGRAGGCSPSTYLNIISASRTTFVVLWFMSMSLGSTQPLIEVSPGIFLGGKGRPARKADNLTAICEPIV
jgi:hypothetical protein